MEYTVTEAKEVLSYFGIALTEQYLRDLLREGKIKGEIRARKIGWLIREEDLQQYLEHRCPVAKDFRVSDYRAAYC